MVSLITGSGIHHGDPSVEAYNDVNATGHNHPKPL
jgi:hypothetical protein